MFFCGKFLPLGDRKKGLENLTKEILGFKKKIAISSRFKKKFAILN
jgi:hypothetical protein